ncbi:MAG: peptidase [Bacillales bacterium]|nr:peptidase [Bacillales bacterium]
MNNFDDKELEKNNENTLKQSETTELSNPIVSMDPLEKTEEIESNDPIAFETSEMVDTPESALVEDPISQESLVISGEQQSPGLDESLKEHKAPKGYMKKKNVLIAGIFIILFNLLFGYKMFLYFENKNDVAEPTIDPEKDIERISDMYGYIMNNYVDEVDAEKLVNGAIKGMVDSLGDKFSEYMSVEDAKQLNELISGSFEGIGAEINSHDGKVVVVNPVKGSPAEKSGLKRDDVIVSVDGKSLAGKSSTDAVKLIRGKKGTTVVLEVQSPGESKSRKVNIIRDTIPLHSVSSHMESNNIGYIEVSSFSGNTADEFKVHLEDLEKGNMKGLILDLRGNPGGLMDVSQKIADYFVPAGKIIVQEEKKGGEKLPFLASKNDGKKITIPVVVMIDGGSASASEIVAAALKESAGATLVGAKSYGKGTIQRPANMPDGSNLKLTIGKWLTPKGTWIHQKGITPDIESNTSEFAEFMYVNNEITYKSGDVSTEVENIKKILNALGFNPGALDGNYNAATVDAVKSFQIANKLPQTGIMTGDTSTKLMEKIRDLVISKGDKQLIDAIESFKK